MKIETWITREIQHYRDSLNIESTTEQYKIAVRNRLAILLQAQQVMLNKDNQRKPDGSL